MFNCLFMKGEKECHQLSLRSSVQFMEFSLCHSRKNWQQMRNFVVQVCLKNLWAIQTSAIVVLKNWIKDQGQCEAMHIQNVSKANYKPSNFFLFPVFIRKKSFLKILIQLRDGSWKTSLTFFLGTIFPFSNKNKHVLAKK